MRHFEFWHPRILETPYYLYLMLGALRRRLPFKFIAKANYALDHGELGFGSKMATQLAFDQSKFLPTIALPGMDAQKDTLTALDFAKTHHYPLILKPDRGRVGKGLYKVHNDSELVAVVDSRSAPYLLQRYTPDQFEYGIFFVRHHGRSRITGINRKHFPTICGDGVQSTGNLAAAHPRYTGHWQSFLRYLDTDRIPDSGEQVRLSFIGSHTLGCKFTNDGHLLTPALERNVFSICEPVAGFNFGRLDVKAASEQAFAEGEFVVIEVNGVASLPTHMFDPDHSLRQGLSILFEHGRHLLDCAAEQRDQPMLLDSWPTIFRRLRDAEQSLNVEHQQLLE